MTDAGPMSSQILDTWRVPATDLRQENWGKKDVIMAKSRGEWGLRLIAEEGAAGVCRISRSPARI
jgi:hypothetical protein